VECALDPEHSQYLRRSNRGTAPDVSVTAPHRAHLREGNRCGRHSGSWEEPTGRATDACQSTPHDDLGSYYGGSKVQAMRCYTAALCQSQRGIRTRSGTSSEGPHAG
jgi:hypothetical protein